MKRNLASSLALLTFCVVDFCQADGFGSGANSFEIEFVTIGEPGNPSDSTGIPVPAGSVPYRYRIGKYEISEQMIDKANALGGLGISKFTSGPNKPATNISWFEAARFINWLNSSTGHSAAYKFDGTGTFQIWQPLDPGYDSNNLFRNSLAKYFLPSVDEWYKAAYFDPATDVYFDFPTGSDTAPTSVASGTAPGTAVYQRLSPADITLAGGLSPHSTMAQGGNVAEWNETGLDLARSPNVSPLSRGGDFAHPQNELRSTLGNQNGPSAQFLTVGFRVASTIPEPSAASLLVISLLGLPILRLRNSTERRRHDA